MMLSWEDLNRDFNKRKPAGDPIDKAFWFKKRYDLESMRKKSTNDILRDYLLKNKIQYVNTYNGDVWFLFQGNWTKCEWQLVNDEIHFYIFEYIWNLDGNTVAELVMLNRLLEEAEEDVATVCQNTHFAIGKSVHTYEVNGALSEGGEANGVGSIDIQGDWAFTEKLPQHPWASADSPNTRTYRMRVCDTEVFDLYRSIYQINTGNHNFRDEMIPWIQKRYLLFKDFVKRADAYEFHS